MSILFIHRQTSFNNNYRKRQQNFHYSIHNYKNPIQLNEVFD